MDKKRRAIYAWCFYDWANSAFALTVMAGFFPVFFKSFWSIGVEPTVSTARLGFGNAIAGVSVAVLSPLLGSIADAGRAKKKLLILFALMGAAATMMLYFVAQGNWVGALAAFVVASIGFSSSNLFYDALLTDVAEAEQMDWVSSLGYATGYLGCGILFSVNVLMVKRPDLFGLANTVEAIRIAFVIAACWWILFSVPLLLFVHEKIAAAAHGIANVMQESFKRLAVTTRKVLTSRSLLLFLIAYWFYIDGVHTFVLMAVDFGLAIGLPASSLMMALLVVQFVAFPSAIVFGKLAKSQGSYKMIMAGIIIYIGVAGIGTLFLRSAVDYIILAGITGTAQGGIQALSRSYFGKMIPAGGSAEYFGFYNVFSRFAVILGPVIVGLVGLTTRKAGCSSVLSSRIGISSISLLFIVGAIVFTAADRLQKREALV